MQVHLITDKLPDFKRSVITIGTFDGVHEGHRKIISALINEAKKIKGESVIITFDPHPRKILSSDRDIKLINTLPEKIELLARTGIDHLVIVPFTKDFSELPADQYISEFLIKNFYPHTIIIGYDHHFGKDRKGNFKLLEQKGSVYKYNLLEIPRHVLEEIAVSSTKIRQAIQKSDIETANLCLGYDFFFEGIVIKGDQLGRQLGFPTANLEYTDSEKIRLGHGVYAAYAEFDNIRLKGMLSIGNRPTLYYSDVRIEINLFDWDQDIYGKVIRIIVKKYLRAQEKYNSLEELKAQLAIDRKESFKVL